MPVSHMDATSSSRSSTSNPIPCSCPWESPRSWPKSSEPCTHTGDLGEAPGFGLAQFQLLQPFKEQTSRWKMSLSISLPLSFSIHPLSKEILKRRSPQSVQFSSQPTCSLQLSISHHSSFAISAGLCVWTGSLPRLGDSASGAVVCFAS